MDILTKGVFYVKKGHKDAPKTTRIWHNCEKYKDRPVTRVELKLETEDEDTAKYACSLCGFEYILDRHLNLK